MMVGEARRKRREHLPKKKKETKKSQTLSLFSPTLGLFDAAEEEGNDTNVFFTNTIENPESGVTCEVLVDAKSGMAKAGIERDEDGDFLYQGTYDENGLRSGEKCVMVGIGDSVVYGTFKNGAPNGWCVYVYPKIADVRKALLSKEDGRARENGMKNLIKECDYVVGYFRDGYVPYFDRDKKVQTGDEDVWYRNASDDRVEMTLDEEMDAILECLSWTKKTHGFEDKSTYEKLRWVTMEEIETKMKGRRKWICPFEANSCGYHKVGIDDEGRSETNFVSIYGCKEGELVAIYSSFPAEVKCFKGLARRWDLRDEISALDDLSDEEDENFSRKDEVRGQKIDAEKRGRGGRFLLCGMTYDGRYRATCTTYGTDAAVHVKEEYNCERVPLYHWKMIGSDYCLCLRALRDIKANERISVGPDYTGGWRLNPYSEAGYYHHLMNTPEKIVFESTKPTKRRGGEVTKKARKAKNDDNEEENISNVKIKRHGPWLCAYIDNVEQGLLYDSNWRESDEDEDGEGKNNATKIARIDRSVVGFEYIRAMATIAIAFGCASDHSWLVPILCPKRYKEMCDPLFNGFLEKVRILNLGFGTGALSGFLCSKLNSEYEQRIDLESVEYSKPMCDVILRNSKTLEFPRFPNEIIHECSAERYLEEELERLSSKGYHRLNKQGFSCVFLDCHDGQGLIPKRCLEKSFIQNIYDCLEKTRGGILVCNCWSGNLKALAEFRETLSSVFNYASSESTDENWVESVQIFKEPSGQTNNCVVVASRRVLTRESEISRKEGEENILEFLRLKFPFEGIPFGLSSGKSLFDASRDLSVSHLGKLEEFTFSFSGVEY